MFSYSTTVEERLQDRYAEILTISDYSDNQLDYSYLLEDRDVRDLLWSTKM